MKKREIAILLGGLLLCFASSSQAKEYSYAELMAGFAVPTGLAFHKDADADRVTPGSFGTCLLIDGMFPITGSFFWSPSFSYLSTNGDVSGDPVPPSDYDIRFQQSEFAVDLLWRPAGLTRFRIGPGVAAAWWAAAEDRASRPVYYYEEDYYQPDTRVVRGQSALLRGTAHLTLRNPQVSGVSMKLIGALPLTDLLKIEDSAASGYVSLQVGFSMILN